jgi:hypothetical protein
MRGFSAAFCLLPPQEASTDPLFLNIGKTRHIISKKRADYTIIVPMITIFVELRNLPPTMFLLVYMRKLSIQ